MINVNISMDFLISDDTVLRAEESDYMVTEAQLTYLKDHMVNTLDSMKEAFAVVRRKHQMRISLEGIDSVEEAKRIELCLAEVVDVYLLDFEVLCS